MRLAFNLRSFDARDGFVFLRAPGMTMDFTLSDQLGQPFHLADVRGKVVVMCFIYTHCTDICAFISVKVRNAYQLLGSDLSNVVFLAVTTDPKRDVPQVTSAYSKALGFDNVWHFVGGAPKDVRAVWMHYALSLGPQWRKQLPPRWSCSSGAHGDEVTTLRYCARGASSAEELFAGVSHE